MLLATSLFFAKRLSRRRWPAERSMPIIDAIPQGFWRELYKRMTSRPAHFKRLLRFLRRKGRSREDAEDLIQEAMLRLHLYGQTVPVMNEEAFLRHAVNNLSIDQHRRDRLDLRKEVPIEELNARSPLIAPESTPEDALEAQQRLGSVRAALDAVSLRTREICSEKPRDGRISKRSLGSSPNIATSRTKICVPPRVSVS
jgi:RNA polymerase sigma-70 factor (ECF subfamily)